MLLLGLICFEVMLVYICKFEGWFKFSEVLILLDYIVIDDMVVGVFVVVFKMGLMFYLYVMWWLDRGGLCGICV